MRGSSDCIDDVKIIEVDMTFITFFLGMILFLPYYCFGIEERLKAEKKFSPFSFFRNMKGRGGKGGILPAFGAALCCLSMIFYFYSYSEGALSVGDQLRCVLVALLGGAGFFYGYTKELLLKREVEGDEEGVGGVLSSLSRKEVGRSFFKAFRDVVFIILFFAFLFFLKNTFFV